MKYPLFTYKGLTGLRKIEEELKVVPFIFQETQKALELDPEMCIDITSLVYFLQSNPANIFPVYVNLKPMTDKTVIIADELVANEAISLLPLVFSNVAPYDGEEDMPDKPLAEAHFLWKRQPIYTYDNKSELEQILSYAKDKEIPIATFSQANGNAKDEFEQFNKAAALALVDLTSISRAIENNKNLIYMVEVFLNLYPNLRIIMETSQIDNILKYFPLYFEGQQTIRMLLPDLAIEGAGDKENSIKTGLKRITDLKQDEFDSFFAYFNHNLIGHSFFKERLKYVAQNFVALNKAKEQKVLSLFLYGASGIGKTEVARLLANGLHEDGYLAKINFQNYSSQDALNSLIGSPAGYIGCDHGELSDKIGKTKIGVLLCDEFEKTTRPVFLFFLELLEEGHFTDSLAREYDLDGFIIVFTSNIRTQSEYEQKIPSELQTRFDLVCEFEAPDANEKQEFLKLLLSKARITHAEEFSHFTMTKEDEDALLGFDCSEMTALRDIKRQFNYKLMDLFRQKRQKT